ncbi:hypothetical protein GGR54DRAFT_642719 [Hypoxylon sp. NC1633]|nr:hypothetical protein GGR54DRAFT_642719 [Hypoxylon sp. NC1633]
MDTVLRPESDPNRKWYGNFIDDCDMFDHKFFKKTPREAVRAQRRSEDDILWNSYPFGSAIMLPLVKNGLPISTKYQTTDDWKFKGYGQPLRLVHWSKTRFSVNAVDPLLRGQVCLMMQTYSGPSIERRRTKHRLPSSGAISPAIASW